MRFRARVDDNHGDMVQALRDLGCSVQSLAAMGHGVPDLLVGFRGRNFLLECKDGSKRPSRRRLSEDEVIWHRLWLGQVAKVETIEEAIRIVCQNTSPRTP